ncbi:hypothetical protein AGMMS49546_12490 [Spirochaetia bacterium]|nr:hypothetical protein AGMMS49546_12490 [Spirochaetia bacterium]
MIENMKKGRYILNGAGILLLCLSYGLLVFYKPLDIGTFAAPVHFNIEVQKDYAPAILLKTFPDGMVRTPVPTTGAYPALAGIVVHAELSGGELLEGIALLLPEPEAEEVLGAIDNISVFIGNTCFYFSTADLRALSPSKTFGGLSYDLSEKLIYKKSLVKKWINWYGDLNFLIRALLALIMYPLRFWPMYIIAGCLFFINRRKTGTTQRGNANWITARDDWISSHGTALFICILVLGFLLHLNGFIQYSPGGDELSSAERAAPFSPAVLLWNDPGNPPFYYILLRLWYTLFGWTAGAGRILSVLAGTAIIPAVYGLVKKYAGIHSALAASFLAAVSRYGIRVSHNTRAYILLMLFVSLLAIFFLNILFQQKKKKNLILYVIVCIVLVNTHYYGVLFVIANFLFFLLYNLLEKKFSWKETFIFLGCNILIALSLVPFLAATALNTVISDQDFNDWIPALSKKLIITIAAGVPLFALAYTGIRNFFLKKGYFIKQQGTLLDYCVFVSCLILTESFLISLVRPILTLRYLSICLPFVLSAAAVFFTLKFPHQLRIAAVVPLWLFAVAMYHFVPNTTTFDVSKEAWLYISADAAAHPDRSTAVLERYDAQEGYYKYEDLSLYQGGPEPDLLYVSPLHCVEQEMYDLNLARYRVEDEGILKVQVDDTKKIFKKY